MNTQTPAQPTMVILHLRNAPRQLPGFVGAIELVLSEDKSDMGKTVTFNNMADIREYVRKNGVTEISLPLGEDGLSDRQSDVLQRNLPRTTIYWSD